MVLFLASKPKGEPRREHAAALGLEPACLFDAVLARDWELGCELALTVELRQAAGVLLALGLGMFPELLLQWVLFLPEEQTLSVRLRVHGSQRQDTTCYSALKSQSKMPPTPRKSSQAAVQGNRDLSLLNAPGLAPASGGAALCGPAPSLPHSPPSSSPTPPPPHRAPLPQWAPGSPAAPGDGGPTAPGPSRAC